VRLREISTDATIFLKSFVRKGGTEVMASKALHRRDAESAQAGDSILVLWGWMQVLESQYQAKTDEELLRLVVELEQLTPEAQVQLHTELAKRGISEARREDFRAEKNQTRTETTEGSKITLLFPSLRRLAET
jgi:hypothetical protein